MSAHDGGIDDIDEVHVPIEGAAGLGAGLQSREDLVPHPGLAPAIESARHRADRAVALLGQVAPRRTGAMNPQDAIEDAAVIVVGPAGARFLGREQRLQGRPLAIDQIKTSHTEQNRNSPSPPQPTPPLQTRPRCRNGATPGQGG